MKFRIDYVTNSSSSSYVSLQYLALPKTEGTKGNFTGVRISRPKEEESDDYPPVTYRKPLPGLAKAYGVHVGMPQSSEKYFTQRSSREELVAFINETYGTQLAESDFLLWKIDYSIGFGESLATDLEECMDDITAGLHPAVRSNAKNLTGELASAYSLRKADVTSSGLKFSRLYFVPEKQFGSVWNVSEETNDNTDNRVVKQITDEDLEWTDATAKFYEHFYTEAGNPNLPLNAMKNVLEKAGLNAREVLQAEDARLEILFVGNPQSNGVIVFRKPAELSFTVLNLFEFRQCYLAGKPSAIQRYFGLSEILDLDQVNQEYRQMLSKLMVKKYEPVTPIAEPNMQGFFEKNAIYERFKKVIKKTISLDGKEFLVVAKPKAALNRFEGKFAELDSFFCISCEYMLEHPDTAWQDLPPVPSDIARKKILEFLKVVLLYHQESNIVRLIKGAERKKNGTLYKKRTQPLAWCEISLSDSLYILQAENTDDLTITLEFKRLDCRRSEIEKYIGLTNNQDILKTLDADF